MKRLCLSFFVTILALASSLPVQAEDEVKGTEYYPLKVGTTWEYAMNGMKATVQVAKHEKFNDVLCAVVETSIGGKVAQTEYVTAGKEGMFRHGVNGIKVEPPALFMKLPFKNAETWKVEFKVETLEVKTAYTWGQSEAKVPAGTYKTIFTKTDKFKLGELEMEATIHYAKGVGMVKTVAEIGGMQVVMELEKFTLGK
jgi:hypothetical protein